MYSLRCTQTHCSGVLEEAHAGVQLQDVRARERRGVEGATGRLISSSNIDHIIKHMQKQLLLVKMENAASHYPLSLWSPL